ncbi:MAG: hypothetical protein IPP35_03030 [Elusimicrobia bacterium]|nr:hypothetical protein [Elusimicrobiota bacterium]
MRTRPPKLLGLMFVTILSFCDGWSSSGSESIKGDKMLGDFGRPLIEKRRPLETTYHIDTPAMIDKIKSAGMKTYLYLIRESSSGVQYSSWEDFRNEFMPAAQAAGIEVWVYLLPPSEGGPNKPYSLADGYGTNQEAYIKWAESIALEAKRFTNLKGFVMDDFTPTNQTNTFSPEFVATMMEKAHRISPSLSFQVVNYFDRLTPSFMDAYQDRVDGIIFPFENLDNASLLNEQIKGVRSLWNRKGWKIAFPPYTWASANTKGRIRLKVNVDAATNHRISFQQRDAFTRPLLFQRENFLNDY